MPLVSATGRQGTCSLDLGFPPPVGVPGLLLRARPGSSARLSTLLGHLPDLAPSPFADGKRRQLA